MPVKKIALLVVIAVVLAAYFWLGGERYLSVSYYQELYSRQPQLTAAVYFGFYIIATAFSLPVGAVITIIGGMIFGFWTGTLLVSFASSIGATLAFLFSRILLRDWIQKHLGGYLKTVNEGMARDGGFYLFSLRLIPVFPFWVINLVFGLTPIRTLTFYGVSQMGMLAGTMVYVNAGAELGAVETFSVSGILTPGLLLSFLLLAVFPFVARALVGFFQRRRAYRGHTRPASFDANLVVIGAGSAGLVSAYIAAAVKSKVVLVEKDRMGGDCLNTGCVPSKALIRAARSVVEIRKAGQLGIDAGEPRVDFARVMERVQQVISTIEPHDSVERYTGLGVDCIRGEATILGPWQVRVHDRVINTRSIVIASGARPLVPPIPGLDAVDYLTSDNLWQLRQLPRRLLVMGGGPIGCELAQAFRRLGSRVTLVDMMPRILPREDEDISAYLQQRFVDEGIEVLVGHKSVGFEQRHGDHLALLECGGETREVAFDRVLVAVGRRANTDNLGLDQLGIERNTNGTLVVDEYLRTRFANILACGDVAGPYQFTHTAAHQAWYATVNALFGDIKKFRVDYRVIPWATFTDPEVAHVGLSEADARQQGIDYEITRYGIDDLDRAIADNAAEGFVKVLTPRGKDQVLGVTIVGVHASDLLTEFVTAMKRGLGLNKILGTIHTYPTLSEANKFAAGEWKRAHAPRTLLNWVARFHRWRRRG